MAQDTGLGCQVRHAERKSWQETRCPSACRYSGSVLLLCLVQAPTHALLTVFLCWQMRPGGIPPPGGFAPQPGPSQQQPFRPGMPMQPPPGGYGPGPQQGQAPGGFGGANFAPPPAGGGAMPPGPGGFTRERTSWACDIPVVGCFAHIQSKTDRTGGGATGMASELWC